MDQNRLSLLALHFVPKIGDHLIRQLVSYCGSPENVFKTPKGKLLKIPGVGSVTADAILTGKPFEKAEKEVTKAQQQGVQLIFFLDKNYPSRLRHIPDAPSLLYVKGNIDFETDKTVAIVGTRNATSYGKDRVEELVSGLVPHGALIVSGLAYGIDIHAHKHALKVGLSTVGIMGNGIDVVYPSAHKETVKKMLDTGGVVSEHPFGTKPDAHNFPQRNRIIAGLADALVVVEAAEKGGALITAEIGNSYNKDVFAFPGNIGETFSSGCNNLIKSNKAHLLTAIKDLEYIMNWSPQKAVAPKQTILQLDGFDEPEKLVIMLFQERNQIAIDELSIRSNLPVSQLASVLLSLEFKGVVQSLPGKQYKLAKR
jgi:DNA processing protein